MINKKRGISKQNTFLIIGIIVVVFLIALFFYFKFTPEAPLFAPGDIIVRSFERVDTFINETLDVTLDVTFAIQLLEVSAVIVENIPQGVEVLDSGTGTYTESQRKIRWILDDVSGLEDVSLVYTIKPLIAQEYIFSGTYVFGNESAQDVRDINGEVSITSTLCAGGGIEVCDGVDNDCNHEIDEGGDDLCGGVLNLCSVNISAQVTSCDCVSDLVNDKIVNGGNCDGVCDDAETILDLDAQGNCDNICDETQWVLDDPDNSDNDNVGSCDGCVGALEILKYKDKFLAGGLDDTPENTAAVANEVNNWLVGLSSCS